MVITNFNKENLIKARGLAWLTQEELGEKAGIKGRQVARYESGDSTPRKTTLYRLAVALDIEPENLLAGDLIEISFTVSKEMHDLLMQEAEKKGIKVNDLFLSVINKDIDVMLAEMGEEAFAEMIEKGKRLLEQSQAENRLNKWL